MPPPRKPQARFPGELDDFRKLKKTVIGDDEFDVEGRRKSHEGRITDIEERLEGLESWKEQREAWENGVDQYLDELRRRQDEGAAHLTRIDTWRNQADVKFNQPPVQQSAVAFKLSKRAIQIITVVATFLAVFTAALLRLLGGG